MSLPNTVFSWAASRSGLGLGDFIASLTPEREEQLLRAYNEWATEKGLKTVHFSSPKPMPTSVAKRQPTPAPVSEQQDELVDLMEAVASEIDEEEAVEATELATTIAEIEAINVPPDDTPIPEDVEEEIKEDAASVSAPVSPILDEQMGDDVPVSPVLDDHMGDDADAADDQTDDDADAGDDHTGGGADTLTPVADAMPQLPIEQRIDKLPKDVTWAIYQELLASMNGDVDTLKAVTEAVIRNHTRRHRGTAPQRAFLAWLNER